MSNLGLLIAVTIAPLAMLWLSAASATELFTHDTLTLHGGPDTRFSALATLPSGTSLTVLWCNGAANWCMVTNGDTRGWAPLNALKSASDMAGSTARATAEASGAAAKPPAAPPSLSAGPASSAAAGILSGTTTAAASAASNSGGIKLH